MGECSTAAMIAFMAVAAASATQVDRQLFQPALALARSTATIQELPDTDFLEEDVPLADEVDQSQAIAKIPQGMVRVDGKQDHTQMPASVLVPKAVANVTLNVPVPSTSTAQHVSQDATTVLMRMTVQRTPPLENLSRALPVSSDGRIIDDMRGSAHSSTKGMVYYAIDSNGTEANIGVPHDRVLDPHPHGTGEAPETPRAIWNKSQAWVTIVQWHPAGVISNVYGGEVRWVDEASYMSFNFMLFLSLLAYPAAWIATVLLLTVGVSLCLATDTDEHTREVPPEDRSAVGEWSWQCASELPLLPVERLSPQSKQLYWYWRRFCRGIPAMTVFGLPAVLVLYCWPRPQEVFSVLTILATGVMYSNALYMALFGLMALIKILPSGPEGQQLWSTATEPRSSSASASEAFAGKATDDCVEPKIEDVTHWVILPQYKEDVEIVSMALSSISQYRLARTCVSVCLAMEERETDAREKVQQLKAKFSGQFLEIFETYHPANLPNDPPGKASNTAWAFAQLQRLLQSRGRDGTNVLLTVSDADSDFHHDYFDLLARKYLHETREDRDLRLWQSPVLHIKNYHRQPGPVVIGTMFTAFGELSCMSDPHAVRFPYSTYSLSYNLASAVGGWDPQWIAEDWHMGIKCFLYTFGKTKVIPIMAPTLNYTPEEPGWLSTVHARWIQAKRHALGFSDMSYYFMMLPLIFGHIVAEGKKTWNPNRFREFLYLLFSGLSLIIKIVNVHVLIGIASSYGLMTFVLSEIMLIAMSPDRLMEYFFDRVDYCPWVLVTACGMLTLLVSMMWMVLYNAHKHRIEWDGKASFVCNSSVLHWVYVVIALQMYAWLFFLALSIATWRAALAMLFTDTFEYEVASKPTKETRLGAAS